MKQIIPRSKDVLSFKAQFEKSIMKAQSENDRKLQLNSLGLFRGTLGNDMCFWIDKVPNVPSNVPRRYFYGKVISKDTSIAIQGKFAFPKSSKLFRVVLFLIMFLILYIPTNLFLIATIGSGMILMLYYVICRIMNINREKKIHKLIESL